MRLALKRKWLYEIISIDQERRLTRAEVQRIARGLGYYLLENYLTMLAEKHPHALFKVDEDMRVTTKMNAWK